MAHEGIPPILREELTRRDLLRAGLWGGLGLAIVSCGGSTLVSSSPSASGSETVSAAWQAILSKARDEGAVNLYGAIPTVEIARLNGAFTSKYGINVTVAPGNTGAQTSRLAAEEQAGKLVGDVIQVGDTNFYNTAASKGWLANPTELPSLSTYPSQHWQNGVALIAIAPYSIQYNTQIVPKNATPNSWKALLDSRWKGKVLFVDPRGSEPNVEWLVLMRKLYGDSYITSFGQQVRYVASQSLGVQEVSSGDAVMVVPAVHWTILTLLADGAPIADAYPTPTTSVNQYAAAVAKGPHPNAALVYLDYAMSNEGQRVLCGGKTCVSPVKGFAGTLQLPASGYAPPDAAAAAAQKAEIVSLMGLK